MYPGQATIELPSGYSRQQWPRDLLEYIKRDIVNVALGNKDNQLLAL